MNSHPYYWWIVTFLGSASTACWTYVWTAIRDHRRDHTEANTVPADFTVQPRTRAQDGDQR